MTTVTFRNEPVKVNGKLPALGTSAPNFSAVSSDLGVVSLNDFRGEKVVLNIFPSVDTGVCAASVRKFHTEAVSLQNVKVLCVSKDLPFAQKRFCAAEGIDNLVMLSDFRGDFEKKYALTFAEGPLAGLLSRAIVVLDENGVVIHSEQVAETTHEPDYQATLTKLK